MSIDKLPILAIKNPEERSKSIEQAIAGIHNGLITLGLEYANKITGQFMSPRSEQYFQLRDSTYYRLDSLVFHLRLLRSVQQKHLQQLQTKPYNQQERHHLLYVGSDQQFQLFDSIVFHAISLFDYFGNLIDFIAGGRNQMRLKWNGVVKAVHDPKNILSRSPIASVVVRVHKELVNLLYEHRSDVIHYSCDRGGAQTTFNLVKGNSEFVVFAPHRLTQRFPALKKLGESYRISLDYVAWDVCDNTINAANSLVEPLLQHLDHNRKTPVGFAIFLSGDSTKPRGNPQQASSDPNTSAEEPHRP